MTTAWILFDLKAHDAKPVNGHVFYKDREPLDDYRNSGSEWLQPEHLVVRQVTLDFDFEPHVPATVSVKEGDPYTSDLRDL